LQQRPQYGNPKVHEKHDNNGGDEIFEKKDQVFEFDNYVGVETHLEAWWSIGHVGDPGNPNDPSTGGFYGYNDTTEIALTDATNISDISDASTYTYSSWNVSPVYEGDIVLFHNIETGYYGAFLIVDIYGSWTGIDAKVDVIWYLQDNGTGDFSDFNPPVPPLTAINHLLLLQE